MNTKYVVSFITVLVLDTFLSGSTSLSNNEIGQAPEDLQRMMNLVRQNRTSVSEEQYYQTLRKLLWRGQYTFLIDYGSNNGNMDARVHRLVARAAGFQLLRYAKGDLREGTTYDQRIEIYNRLAPLCTKHYEVAIEKSPDDDLYFRAQLADEWLTFKALTNSFKSDSQLLRHQLPTHPEYESRISKEQIEAQAKRFRNAVKEAIGKGKQGQMFAQQTRDEITRSLVAEFRIYSQIGIPDTEFNEIIRDIPFLFDEGLPMRFFRNMSNISQVGDTFKWYLWRAIITPLPDKYERQEIERQLGYFNDIVTRRTEELEIPTEYRPHFDKFINRWESMYDRLKDIRFVPYFKRALPPYRFQVVCAQINDAFTRRHRDIDEDIALLKLLPKINSKNEKEDKMPGIYERQGFATLVDIFAHYVIYDCPLYLPLPDKGFYQHTGTLNRYSVYTFIPDKGTPL